MTEYYDGAGGKYGSLTYGNFFVNVDVPAVGEVPYLLAAVRRGASLVYPTIGTVTLSKITTYSPASGYTFDIFGTDAPPEGVNQPVYMNGYSGHVAVLTRCVGLEAAGTYYYPTQSYFGAKTLTAQVAVSPNNKSDMYLSFLLAKANYGISTIYPYTGQTESSDVSYGSADDDPRTCLSYFKSSASETLGWNIVVRDPMIQGSLLKTIVAVRAIPYSKPFIGRGYIIQ